MGDLITALTVLQKYLDKPNNHTATHCEHDILMVMDVSEDAPNAEDAAVLEKLGFFWSGEYDCWASFRFGSA